MLPEAPEPLEVSGDAAALTDTELSEVAGLSEPTGPQPVLDGPAAPQPVPDTSSE